MCEWKCLLSAFVYFLAQLVVVLLKPVVHSLDVVAKKWGVIAGENLAKIAKPVEAAKAEG